jgi:tol-pal system beta propeller repeat protein TolB
VPAGDLKFVIFRDLRDGYKWRLRSAMITAAAVVVCGAAFMAASTQEAKATFPGSNGRIAFTLFPEVGDSEIYKVRPDGSGLKEVTFNATDDVRPAWSPDGTRISFTRFEKIFVKDTTSAQVVRLTDDTGISSFASAWSPDGTRLAFDSNRDGDQEIYTMNSLDGSGLEKLTDNQNHDVEPTWSPDGTKIAFSRDYDIWVMNADGTKQKNLTDSPELDEYEPDWSPDGAKIAFTNGSSSDIWVMDADGSGRVNLTNTPSVSDDYPAWSPNGNKIAFESRGDIFKMNSDDGSGRVNLTNTPDSGEYLPDWQAAPTPSG